MKLYHKASVLIPYLQLPKLDQSLSLGISHPPNPVLYINIRMYFSVKNSRFICKDVEGIVLLLIEYKPKQYVEYGIIV